MSRNRILSVVFMAVFLLILIIGLIHQISLRVSIGRAFLAAVIFTSLLLLVMVLLRYFTPPGQPNESPDDTADAVAGQAFTPLTGRQVDPDMAEILNQNPDKLAEIVEKMGFDE